MKTLKFLRARSVTSVQKSTVSAKALPSEKTAKPGVNGGKTVKKKLPNEL